MTVHPWFLTIHSLLELLRYDVAHRIFGYRLIHRSIVRKRDAATAGCAFDTALEAFNRALILYPKRVMCLQRSVALARVLCGLGLQPRVVIGYRPRPFFGHAWVELDGAVVNDSVAYREQLLVLDRI
jgi:hypothetical protein